MPSRIDHAFSRLRSSGQSGFIAYVTAGDPTPSRSLEILRALEEAGADILEVGIPFSDPLADGPTIQAAAGRALAAGMTAPKVLDLIHEFRQQSELPIVLFTYLNPLFARGFSRFANDAAEAGADGLLVLDMPPEEEQAELAAEHGLDSIRLVAPTTPADRMRAVCAGGRGFVYYVSREGVTGEQSDLSQDLESRLKLLREVTTLPIAVGFGVSTAEQARWVGARADAVVVGSAVVRRVGEAGDSPAAAARVAEFVRPLAAAAHSARGG